MALLDELMVLESEQIWDTLWRVYRRFPAGIDKPLGLVVKKGDQYEANVLDEYDIYKPAAPLRICLLDAVDDFTKLGDFANPWLHHHHHRGPTKIVAFT